MIDTTKQYKTREGREVRIYATDCGGIYPVHGAILKSDGWVIHCWRGDGSDAIDSISNADLIEVKPRMKIERWALVGRDGGYSLWLDKPSDASIADAFGLTRIAFEVEEGEGLDAV